MDGSPDPDRYLDHVLVDSGSSAAVPALRGPAATWQCWWRDQRSDIEPLRTASRQGFVLAVNQLPGLGVSRSSARTALRNGRWWTPVRGTVAPVRIVDGEAPPATVARRRHALIATAAAMRRPEHVVAARSAAVLSGLPTLATPTVAELGARYEAGLGRRRPSHFYGASIPPEDIRGWFGVPVTAVARTVVDLARHDRRDGLLAADAALHEQLITPSELDYILLASTGWPGIRRARAVLALADARSESPLESLLRLALHDDGLPPPELQVEIGGYRVDFCWPAQWLIVEADGRGKYTGDELWAEKVRETRLRALGFRVERVIWADATRLWPQTSARLRSALAA